MKFANKSIIALMFLSIKSFCITTAIEELAAPLVITSDQEKRLLTSTCATFTHTFGSPVNDPNNWIASDSTFLGTSLFVFCSTYDCCRTGAGSVMSNECTNWSMFVAYKICDGSCKGVLNGIFGTCNYIAGSSVSGSVTINSNACSGADNTCNSIGYRMQTADIEVGTSACTGINGVCSGIGLGPSLATRFEVPANECNQANGGYPNVGKCQACGKLSTFSGTFVATDTCCAADGKYYGSIGNSFLDEECNYTPPPPPPEEPNPCKNVNCSNAGKCQVLSFTEAECKCENTFIHSETKLDCICPSDYEFHANVNRCFPITEAPSKSPTSFPTVSSSASPSQRPTEKEAVCEDDETATFELIKVDKDVPCSWINKNWKKRAIRKEKYCALDNVKAICPEACGLCPE